MSIKAPLVLAAFVIGLAGIAEPAAAQPKNDAFRFTYSKQEMRSKVGNAAMQNRLQSQANRYCRSKTGSNAPAALRRQCARKVQNRVNSEMFRKDAPRRRPAPGRR